MIDHVTSKLASHWLLTHNWVSSVVMSILYKIINLKNLLNEDINKDKEGVCE